MPRSISINRSFSPLMGLVVATIVVYGFGYTVDKVLIHYTKPPPSILYVHLLVSSAWLLLFIAQSALVSTRNVRLHRRLGIWGIALGTAVSLVGLITVFVMRRRDIDSGGGAEAVAFLSIPLYSLGSFAVPFFMAAWCRTKPELHRRLMMLATCSLTFAALARVPALGDTRAPVVTDFLMIIAAGVDWMRTRRLHPVYLIGIPAMISGEVLCLYLAQAAPPAWMAIAKFLLGRT